MGIDPVEFRLVVIAPALDLLGLGGDEAEELLLGTALQELKLAHLEQHAGPALGVFQMEPATHDDLVAWLGSRPQIEARINRLVISGVPRCQQLAGNFYYAAAMARCLYWRVPEGLPRAGDLAAQADFYKRHWNTPEGKATTSEYVASWRSAFPARVAQASSGEPSCEADQRTEPSCEAKSQETA